MNHPRLSIIFSSLHPPFLPLSKIRRDPGRTLCCTSLRPEKEEKGETERNIRQTSLRNLFRAFPTLSTENGGTYQSILSFHREISDSFPRSAFGLSSPSLSFLFTSSSTSRSHNFSALSAKLAVYPREENERNNGTSFRDATEDPTIFRWDDISLLF